MPGSKRRKKTLVFLSHANEDKPAVRRLCNRLKGDGFDPWLDEERLLPGQDWHLEIEQAMRKSDVLLLCFSEKSVSKEGYIQREYKKAMIFQEEKPGGTIFVIPVRLDECQIPFFLRELQFVDFPSGYERLVKALNIRAGDAISTIISKKTKNVPSVDMKKNYREGSFEDSSQIREGKVRNRAANLNVEREFLQRVFAESRFVALGGIDSKISDPRQKSVELKSIYVDLLTTEVAEDIAPTTYLKDPIPVSALNALNQHNKLVILGGPGSGKSTFVKFLTLCLSGDRLDDLQSGVWINQLRADDATWSHGHLIPIKIALGEIPINEIFAKKKTTTSKDNPISTLLTFVLKSMKFESFLKLLMGYMQRGDVIFFFDGLDEVVQKDARLQIAKSISSFAEKYPKCRYVVTCRTASYPHSELEAVKMPWMLRDFRVVTLGTLDDKRIRQFINLWFDELSRIGRFNENVGRNKAGNLDNALRARMELRRIAASPLLLTVMAIVHDHYGELPDTKVALYQKCTDLLLWRWEAVKHGSRMAEDGQNLDVLNSLGLQRIVKPRDIERILYQIVFNAHSQVRSDELAHISANELKEGLGKLFVDVGIAPPQAYQKATDFVDIYIRERVGLLDEKQDGVLEAVHRSFQEYLAARHLCSQRDFSRLAVSLVNEGFDQWREVFLMAVEQMVLEGYDFQAIDTVNRLYHKVDNLDAKGTDVYILVGEAVTAIGKPSLIKDTIGQDLVNDIGSTFYALCRDSQLIISKRAHIGSFLGDIGDPRFEPAVVDGHAVIFPELIYIPAGTFKMGIKGSSGYDLPDEVLFEVELPEYQIAKYPVTEAEFELFVRASGSLKNPSHWRQNRPPEGKNNHPVTDVSWEVANQYCKWLTTMAQKQGYIPAHKIVRLPTEAEWEKAMRWDEKESVSRLYPWGDQWVAGKCNTIEVGLGSTTPVGIFVEGNSPYDVSDGVGNVFEWCNSLAKEYPYRVDDGREMQNVRGLRIARGGSWYTTQRFASCIYRGRMSQESKSPSFGFRVVIANKIE